MSALEGLDPASREIAITQLLGQAKQFMEVAMKQPDAPRIMADFKAQIITIAEYAKQKRMSEELQIDATVMVRRSERGLGVAIREGQDRGDVATLSEMKSRASAAREVKMGRLDQEIYNSLVEKPTPTTFATSVDLSGNGAGIWHMTDEVTDTQFDEALTAAVDERNVSRANVVRKIKGEEKPKREPASPNKTAQMMDRVTTALWGLRHSLQEITAVDADLDPAQTSAWIKEFTSTSQELNRIKNLLKGTQK